jgi:hypothetical protein
MRGARQAYPPKKALQGPLNEICGRIDLFRREGAEPFYDPVVGPLSAWPSRQLSSGRLRGAGQPKAGRLSSSWKPEKRSRPIKPAVPMAARQSCKMSKMLNSAVGSGYLAPVCILPSRLGN